MKLDVSGSGFRHNYIKSVALYQLSYRIAAGRTRTFNKKTNVLTRLNYSGFPEGGFEPTTFSVGFSFGEKPENLQIRLDRKKDTPRHDSLQWCYFETRNKTCLIF